MGNEFYVKSWKKTGGEYYWITYHGGENYDEAIKKLHELKEDGHKCLRLEWRPK